MVTIEELKDKIIVGLDEKIQVYDDHEVTKKVDEFVARIDSGATMSSIDRDFAVKHNLANIVGTKIVKQATGKTVRDVITLNIEIKGKKLCAKFTMADRSGMTYKALIGQNILKDGFLIDPSIERLVK